MYVSRFTHTVQQYDFLKEENVLLLAINQYSKFVQMIKFDLGILFHFFFDVHFSLFVVSRSCRNMGN